MISTKKKWISILAVAVLGIVLAGFGAFNRSVKASYPEIDSVDDLKNVRLGGVNARMPENSAKILFEGILGFKLKSYTAYNTVEETLYALYVNEVQSAWFSDVTARYLLKTREGLKEIHVPDIISEDRLEFAMALRPEDEGLRGNINASLAEMTENGKLKELTDQYIDWDYEPEEFYEKNMRIREKGYSYSDTIYVGITGMTPPIEILDISNKPYGFCVALMDEIAVMNGLNVKFVYVNHEAAFSSLMAGKIDILFCYGTSTSTLDPDNVVRKRSYIMTDGYYGMNQYSFLVLDQMIEE